MKFLIAMTLTVVYMSQVAPTASVQPTHINLLSVGTTKAGTKIYGCPSGYTLWSAQEEMQWDQSTQSRVSIEVWHKVPEGTTEYPSSSRHRSECWLNDIASPKGLK